MGNAIPVSFSVDDVRRFVSCRSRDEEEEIDNEGKKTVLAEDLLAAVLSDFILARIFVRAPSKPSRTTGEWAPLEFSGGTATAEWCPAQGSELAVEAQDLLKILSLDIGLCCQLSARSGVDVYRLLSENPNLPFTYRGFVSLCNRPRRESSGL
jgi:hypothetical protein